MKNQKATIFNEQLPIEYKNRFEQLHNDCVDRGIIDWDLAMYLLNLKDSNLYVFRIWTIVYDLSYLSMNGVMRMEEGKPILDEDWVCEFVDVMRKVQTICETPMSNLHEHFNDGSCPKWEHHQNIIRWRHFQTA